MCLVKINKGTSVNIVAIQKFNIISNINNRNNEFYSESQFFNTKNLPEEFYFGNKVSHSDAMDRRAWRATVHGVAKLQPMGSDTTELLTLE